MKLFKKSIGKMMVLVLFILLVATQMGLAKQVNLVFWLDGSIEDAPSIKLITDNWNKENPNVQVELVAMPAQDPYLRKLEMAAAAGTGADIVRLDELFLPQFAESNVIANVDDLARGSNGLNFEDLNETALSMTYYKGDYWGYPENYTWNALAYRKDLFKEAGLTHPPRTWDEFLTYAKKLTHDRQYGFVIQPYDWWWLNWFWKNGGTIFNEDMSGSLLNSAEGVEALQFYIDLYQKHEVVPASAVSAFRTGGGGVAFSAENAFINGQVAMLQVGPWLNSTYRKQSTTPNDQLTEEYGYAPMPSKKGKEDITNSSTIGGRVMAVTRWSQHKKEAWDFIKYLIEERVLYLQNLTKEKGIEKALEEMSLGALLTRKSTKDLPIGNHPHVKAFIDRAEIDPKLRPRFTRWIRSARVMNSELQAALVEKKSSEEALNKMVEVINEEINKIK